VLVEMSTFAISDKEKAARVLKKAGHTMIDCPVSGTGAQAKKRDLVFYASGSAGAIARLRPLLNAFGRHTFNVGPFGNGSRMKYVANLLVAINNVAAAEAMVLGMKAGLDPRMIVDLITAGAGNSRVFELRAPMMAKGRYDDVTMKISVWDKDMQVIGDYARKIRVPTPIFSATKGIYLKAMKSGLGNRDTAAVCAVLEKMAKVKRRAR
jgi:3-hydroxyisobutyrate dehydrogenase-like beta-hydroxyacid dehydrogenase